MDWPGVRSMSSAVMVDLSGGFCTGASLTSGSAVLPAHAHAARQPKSTKTRVEAMIKSTVRSVPAPVQNGLGLEFVWLHNPLPVEITDRTVDASMRLALSLAAGGGQAILIRPQT